MSNTSENNKRIAKNTLLLYFRSIIVMLVSLYTSRIVLKSLGIEDYGIYNVVGGLVSMFSLISSSMVNTSSRFITFELGRNNFNGLKKTVSGCITIHILLGLIIVVIAEIVGVWFLNYKMNIPPDRIVAANWVFQCSLFIFFFNLISTPYNAIIISREKMSAFAYISILDVSLKLLIVFLLTWILYDKLIVYTLLMLFVSVLMRIIYLIYCKIHFAEARKISLKIDANLFKQLFSFTSWEMIGSGAAVLRGQGIDILLNLFFGVIVNAAKGIANQVQSAIYSFVSNFQMAINPQITKNYAANDYQRVHFLIKQGTRFSFYLFLVLSMPIMLETKMILDLWLVKAPSYSVVFVQLTFVNLLINTFYRFMVVAISATGRIKIPQLVVGCTKLLALPLTYLFLKLGGSPTTGLLVVIFIEIVCVFFNMYFMQKMLEFNVKDFIRDVMVKSLSVLAVASILPLILKIYFTFTGINQYLYLCLITAVSLLSCGLSIYYFGLLQGEKQIVKKIIRKRLKIYV